MGNSEAKYTRGSAGGMTLLYITLVAPANTAFCALLIAAALLRETPEFWRNSGGYPVILREILYWFFYPCLLLCTTGTAQGAWLAFHLLRKQGREGWLLLILCVLQLLALVTILGIVLWNNISNLLHGVPLHHHSTSL